MCLSTKFDSDVVIIGGGPIGLMLGNLLGKKGLKVIVLERRIEHPRRSMAIGITPPTLDILRFLELDSEFIRSGIRVRRTEVFEKRRCVGELVFDNIPSRYRFFLSLPQSETRRILLAALQTRESTSYRKGVEFCGLEQNENSICVHGRDFISCRDLRLRTRFAIGCDGVRGAFRAACGIGASRRSYSQRWVMGDVGNHESLGEEARLYFGPDGSIESFPLPQGKRRWIAQIEQGEVEKIAPALCLRERVRKQTGIAIPAPASGEVTTFGAQRILADRFHDGRAFLCGDAAHVMSSIGGQGMNTGFASAEFLAEAIKRALDRPEGAETYFRCYERFRRRSFNVAANRAARGMWLGTLRGNVCSALRGWFIERILFGSGIRHRLAPYFSMLTIPNRTLAHSEWSPVPNLKTFAQ